ncbi:MAG: undecaprenyl-phosphate alpha-N-acetylglucosaminyl 1-phosphate transferase [Pseudohongiella sp.]|nr:MAG: undecaprenyl-phosphate alpha-N-acetylglucosaminyl 1-phosphate transferase [Pseudohongiella sp.]
MNLVYLLSSFTITGAALLLLKPIAHKVGLVDIPGGRKTHLSATPLVGGLGIFLGIITISFLMPGVSAQFAPLLSLSALILFIGTVDDAKELTPFARMLGHGLVALAMAVVAGVELRSLGALVTQNSISLGALTLPVTVFATVGVINAINMADGVDGLSGGLVIVTLGFISLLAFAAGQTITGSFCLIMICSIAAFLGLNFRQPWHKKALVYLGDAGSTMLGFMLAWLLITNTQGANPSFAPVYALWFLAVPLFDTVNLLIKRPLRGRSPFAPGTDHLHHMLLSRGLSVKQVVALLLCSAITLGGAGYIGNYLGASESLMFQLFIVLFCLYFYFSDRIEKKPSHC